MFQIPSNQMVALDQASERLFIMRTASHVFAEFPRWSGAQTADDATAMVTRIVSLLQQHAITEEAQHVDIVTAFARNDVAWPWPPDAHATLAAPLCSSVRVSRLIDDADLGTWRLVPITLSTDVLALVAIMESRQQ